MTLDPASIIVNTTASIPSNGYLAYTDSISSSFTISNPTAYRIEYVLSSNCARVRHEETALMVKGIAWSDCGFIITSGYHDSIEESMSELLIMIDQAERFLNLSIPTLIQI